LSARLANALAAYASYLGKTFWPVHLAVFYPLPRGSLPVAQIAMAGLLMAAVTFLVLGLARRRPYLPVGWFWFLGTLVPVIGLVQVGGQSMADRYTYVPSIGLFLMLSWGAADLAAIWRLPRWGLVAAGGLTLCACSVLTWFQIGSWRSTSDLWKRATEATENNLLAYTNLGVFYTDEGRYMDANRAFEQAVAIAPDRALPHANLGNVYGELGKWDRAAEEFREAIRLEPDAASPHYYLGNALVRLGQREEAIAEYRKAIELNSEDARPHTNLGIQLDYLNRLEEAEAEFRAALELAPTNAEYHNNLGMLLVKLDRPEEAHAAFRRAIALNPKENRFHVQLAGVLQEEGRLDEAWDEYQTALDLGDAQVRRDLQVCARLRALQPRLDDLIAGRDQPANTGEQLAFAMLCGQRLQRRYALAARLYSEAFRAEPRLAGNSPGGHRFHAAVAAAAAGCGQDAAALDEKERASLRKQALEWLRAELDFSTRLVQRDRPDIRATAGYMLRRWQHDARLAGVRDQAALGLLPETEQRAWRNLWSDVTAILSQVDMPRTKRAASVSDGLR
jgi:Flp pilus assembly protein TadD